MSKTKDQIQTEALLAIGDLRRAGVEISMGVGKTRIGLKHMANQYTDIKRFLVVAPKVSIFQSWLNDMKEFGYDYLKDHITFTTYLSLTKHDHDYDYIYLDECHSLKANHNQWLLDYLKQGGRVLGMTGTYPVRKSTEKGKMCYFYCPKVYTYLPDEAIEDKILNNYKIFVHELQLSNKQNIAKTGAHGDFMTSEVRDYQYWCKRLEDSSNAQEEMMLRIKRMQCLQNFESKLHYAKLLFRAQTDKAIVFANTKKQADYLCADSYHSSNPKSIDNLDLFKLGGITKLSAVEQLSEGITIPGLKIGIIMHAYSNNTKATQKIGRLLRLTPEDTATIHILCYENSIDKEWVTNALKSFDQSKISWIKPLYHAGVHY